MKKVLGLMCMAASLFGQQIEVSTSGKMDVERFENYKKRYNLKTFIETGTYMGATTAMASPYFENVYTIELSEKLYKISCNKLRRYTNIHLRCGYSEIELEKLLKERGAASTMVFLDAHYSLGTTARAKNDPPVLDELLLLANYAREDTVIILDDVRCFSTKFAVHERHSYYPYLRDIKEYVESNFKTGFRFCIIGDQALIYNPDFYNDKISDGVELFTAMYIENDMERFLELALTIPDVFSEEEQKAIMTMAHARLSSSMLNVTAAILKKDNNSSANRYLRRARTCGLNNPTYEMIRDYINKTAL